MENDDNKKTNSNGEINDIINKNNDNLLEIFNKRYNTELTLNSNNLDLSKKNIGNEGFKLLSEIPFNQINIIKLLENNISDLTPLLKFNLTNLTQLNLSKNKIENLEIFTKLNLTNLSILDLSFNKLKEIKCLQKINLNNLHELILGCNQIGDISDLEFMKCPNLQKIDLYQNEIKDITVFERIKCPHLNEIAFANNYFDHELIKNYDIIMNLRKKGCNVIIWGTVKQVLSDSI